MLPEPEISILEVNQMRRTKCLVFTRVMGYLRPVESFNLGKRESIKKEYILLRTRMNKPIYHITPFSMLDFPDMLSCIIWFAGCNMNCGYCYNVDVVRGKGK